MIVPMSEREFWLQLRRAALTFANAIEARYGTTRPSHPATTPYCADGSGGGASPPEQPSVSAHAEAVRT